VDVVVVAIVVVIVVDVVIGVVVVVVVVVPTGIFSPEAAIIWGWFFCESMHLPAAPRCCGSLRAALTAALVLC
jgi:hypothetical protein